MKQAMSGAVVAVIGGDGRMTEVVRWLTERVRSCRQISSPPTKNEAWDGLSGADVVVLPISRDGVCVCCGNRDATPITSILDAVERLCPEAAVFSGNCSAQARVEARTRNIALFDYARNEDFQLRNAIPTAEGALALAIGQMSITLCGSTAVVVGYGRIGRKLTRLLSAFGAEVRVGARREDSLREAAIVGARTFHTTSPDDIRGMCEDADVIFNTVPALLLGADALKAAAPHCVVLDLASAPCGVDLSAAAELGLRASRAPGLPGKFSPVTAGEILAQTVFEMMEEERS